MAWATPLSEYGRIRRIALRRPADSFVDQSRLDAEWQRLNFTSRPDYARAVEEYERLAALFADLGAEIDYLPAGPGLTIDSIYVRDAAIVGPAGVILCNMGKPERRGELRQLGRLVGPGVEVVVADMPHYRGPGDVFHLMSVLSPIDRDLALVYSPLMPIRFRDLLIQRNIRLVEVPEAEFDSMGCNVLTIAPRRCVMLKGNPLARVALEAAGAEVTEIDGAEISAKGQGGPTCLTRPLLRD